jgi:hypothetical protein
MNLSLRAFLNLLNMFIITVQTIVLTCMETTVLTSVYHTICSSLSWSITSIMTWNIEHNQLRTSKMLNTSYLSEISLLKRSLDASFLRSINRKMPLFSQHILKGVLSTLRVLPLWIHYIAINITLMGRTYDVHVFPSRFYIFLYVIKSNINQFKLCTRRMKNEKWNLLCCDSTVFAVTIDKQIWFHFPPIFGLLQSVFQENWECEEVDNIVVDEKERPKADCWDSAHLDECFESYVSTVRTVRGAKIKTPLGQSGWWSIHNALWLQFT